MTNSIFINTETKKVSPDFSLKDKENYTTSEDEPSQGEFCSLYRIYLERDFNIILSRFSTEDCNTLSISLSQFVIL